MIPEFNELGVLPEGIYECSLEELKERFAINLKRKRHFEGLSEMLNDLRRIHCKIVYIDGSYVTDKALPSDIDVCFDCEVDHLEFAILQIGNFYNNQKMFQEKYSCNVFPSSMSNKNGLNYVKLFQKIKYTDTPKGIIKINL